MATTASTDKPHEEIMEFARVLWRYEADDDATTEDRKAEWVEKRPDFMIKARKLLRALERNGWTVNRT